MGLGEQEIREPLSRHDDLWNQRRFEESKASRLTAAPKRGGAELSNLDRDRPRERSESAAEPQLCDTATRRRNA